MAVILSDGASAMQNLLFKFEDLSSKDKVVKEVARQFKRAGAEVAQSEVFPQIKRSSGVTYKEIVMAFADSQAVTLRIKQSGDIFQVLVNKKLLPIKHQDDHVAAINEIVDALSAGRAKFQKALALLKVKLPPGVKTAAPRMFETLAARAHTLKEAVFEAQKQIEGKQGQLAALDPDAPKAALDGAGDEEDGGYAEIEEFSIDDESEEGEADEGGNELDSALPPDLGPVFTEYENDPEGAIERLLKEKKGDARAVWKRPGLGTIDLIWGNSKGGLAHIKSKHPEILPKLPNILKRGRIVTLPGHRSRYIVVDGTPPMIAAIALDWFGIAKTWVVTSYEDGKGGMYKKLMSDGITGTTMDTADTQGMDDKSRHANAVGSIIDQEEGKFKNREPARKTQRRGRGMTMLNRTYWTDDATPVSGTLDRVLYDIRRDDHGQNLLLDAVSEADILEGAEEVAALDALITPYKLLERRMTVLQRVMERAATGDVKPVAMQITKPFKQRGSAQVAVIFELSDGQTVAIFFHNPDTTPGKITPQDELVSWKWLLNKKDITIVVAPERGKDLNIHEVSRRVLRLASKNSASFQRANARRGERLAGIVKLKDEIAGLEKSLAKAQDALLKLDIAIEEAHDKRAKGLTKSPGEQTEANGGGAEQKPGLSKPENTKQSQDWWGNEELSSQYAAIYLIGKSRGKESLSLTADSKGSGYYLARVEKAGLLRERGGTAEKIVEWLRAEILCGLGGAISGKSLTREEARAKLKLVKGEDILFGKRTWQTDAENDPAGGAAAIESWDAAKADALLHSLISSDPSIPVIPAARQFIENHLQGRIVKTEKGNCIINNTSKGKLPLGANKKGSLKLEAITRIPEILIGGKAGDFNESHKGRNDVISGFYPFEKVIEIPAQKLKANVVIKVGRRENGIPNLVYDLNAKELGLLDSVKKEAVAPPRVAPREGERNMDSTTASVVIIGGTPSEVNAVLDSADDGDGLNLQILAVWGAGGKLIPELADGYEEPAPSKQEEPAALSEGMPLEEAKPNAVELTGKELGDFPEMPDGLKALRKAAIDEFSKLRGEFLDCPAVGGKVEIRKRGIDKVKSSSADPLKLKILPKIREILASATKIGTKPNYDKANSPNIVAYHTLRAIVHLNEQGKAVRIVIAEDDKGMFHYDHTLHEVAAILDSATNESPTIVGLSESLGGNLGFTRNLRVAPGATSLLSSELSEEQRNASIIDQHDEKIKDVLDTSSPQKTACYVINLFIEGQGPEYVEVEEPEESPPAKSRTQTIDETAAHIKKIVTPDKMVWAVSKSGRCLTRTWKKDKGQK